MTELLTGRTRINKSRTIDIAKTIKDTTWQ